ncbi:MAG: lasso peptide biosynthesis B2 protein [Thermoanaerobaculales bacterium]
MRPRAPLLLLLPAVLRASFRARRLYRALPLDHACRALSEVQPLPLPLRDPAGCLRLVNRLVWVLPPRGLRPCLKRSFLLLDLWSRCGLAPRFHLGVRHTADRCEGHAWVTVAGRPDLSAAEPGYTEAFVWEGTGS